MPILELTLQQEYFGQNIINRWNYVSTGGSQNSSKAYALADALGFVNIELIPETGVTFFAIIRTLQNDNVFSSVISVRDVYSDTDFYARELGGVPGVQGGDTSASFVSFGFRSNQITKRVRPGQKRLVGVRDNDTVSGGAFTPTTTTQLALVASAMSEVRIYDPAGENITFTPAVCARERYTAPSGNPAYRYYPDEATQLANTAIGVQWTPKPSVRSQVSRVIGRGG